uniref:Plastid-encoded RNA polymerase subunit alpha n=1 Tax=Pseudoderbesia arbuscula TaxID=2320809 RepID=A0A386AYK6_9CHLO|nr:RNA polymerase a-subunit [Pseudoderbesia arbuscula]
MKHPKLSANDPFTGKQSIFSCIETRIDQTTPDGPAQLYACFQLGFFPKNQGLTIANALRRTLLNESTECTITGVFIEDVKHEYSSIQGIKETVFDLLINLKKIIFFSQKPFFKTHISVLSENGPMILKAKNLKLPNFLFCINPDQYITTLENNGRLNMTLFLDQSSSKNFSYLTNEYYSHFYTNFFPFKLKNKKLIQKESSHFLFLETQFCPIYNLNYKIQQIESQKELIFLEIWTNGSIHPSFILKKAIQTLLISLIPFYLIRSKNLKKEYKDNRSLHFSREKNIYKILSQKRFIQKLIKLDLTNFPLSFTTYQTLKKYNIFTIGDLYKRKRQKKFLQNFSKKEFLEIQRLFRYLKYYFFQLIQIDS